MLAREDTQPATLLASVVCLGMTGANDNCDRGRDCANTQKVSIKQQIQHGGRMSYEEIDESTLTPEELIGQREFDEIQRRYLSLIEETKYNPDPRELEIVVYERDCAEDDLVGKSANARAYIKRIMREICPEAALVAAIPEPTCGYVTVDYITNPAQLCGKPAAHYHEYNITKFDGEEEEDRLAGAF